MRVLFADAFPSSSLPAVEALGWECVLEPGLTAEELPRWMPGVDVLVVRSTRVSGEAIAAGDRLGVVVRAGAGTNTIDCQAAADRGIYVCNVPGKNAVAVAELAIGLMCALDRGIPDAVADLRAGRWDKRRYAEAQGLFGRSVGVVGLGQVGLAFAERAAALGLGVYAVERRGRSAATVERAEAAGVRFVADLETLAATCEILSLHLPATEATRGLVGRELLARLKPGAWIINTARGELIDEAALLEAIETKGIRAGLDVFCDEPATAQGRIDSPLARHPNVYGTHHIGASTAQAQAAIAEEVVRILGAYAAGQVLHCVNLETRPLGSATLVVRHADEVGVLAEILDVLKKASLNVEQMDNRIFAGARAACATLQVSGEVPEDLEWQLAQLDRVFCATVRLAGAGEEG